MSIRKIDTLNFEREFPDYWGNENQDLEFTSDGLEIEYDTLPWDDIKSAYSRLFGKSLDTQEA